MAGPNHGLALVWDEIAASLPAEWRQPARVEQRSPRAWKVTGPGGATVGVKLAVETARVEREGSVLRFLHRRGCAVPRVVAAGSRWLVTEWAGDETLDDVLQRGRGVDAALLTAAVRAVSEALSSVAGAGDGAGGSLRAQLAPWAETLRAALEWLGVAAPERVVAATVDRAVACEPRPGSLDYTSRNVVVDSGKLSLLDFAATGFDWDERRLAQYALSAGAAMPDAEFRSALTAAAVGAAWDVEGVDAHEAVLLLIAAEQLRQVEAGEAHADRAAGWRNVAQRKASLRRLLARPLCSTGPAAALRRLAG